MPQVKDPALLDMLNGGDAAPSARGEAYPGIIRGAPKAPDPVQARNLELAEERVEIARRGEERAAGKEARDEERREKGFDATEGERKAAAFLLRALGANSAYVDSGVGPRNIVGQAFSEAAPDLLNTLPSSVGNSPKRQIADTAQDEFIAASLRQDSGAAIPEEELERQRRIYFPMPGDTEEVIKAKAGARQRAIAGLQQSSGRLLENTLAEWEKMQAAEGDGPAPAAGAERDAEPTFDRGYFDENGKPLPDDFQGGVYDAQGEYQGLVANVSFEGETFDERTAREAAEADREAKKGLFGEAGASLDDMGTLGQQGISLGLADEAQGVGGAISALFSGENVAEGYTNARDQERARVDIARENLGWGGTVLEVAGGGAGALARGGQVINAGRKVVASGQPLTRGALKKQVTRTATRDGTTVGALGGFGYGEGLEGSAISAVGGAIAGGVLGNLGQRVANREPKARQGASVLAAADDLGIQPIPAVTAGTTTQKLTSGARQGFISDRPIAANVARMEEQGLAARGKIADDVGRSLDAEDAGGMVRQAANIYSQRTSNIGGKLYDRADRLAGGQTFATPTAVQRADKWLGELGQSVKGEQGAIYQEVKKVRDTLADGEFSLMSIPRTRDEFRAQLQERGLRGSTLDTAMKDILDGVEADILAGLRQSGNDAAANAFKTATSFWAKRVETIDEVLEPILGKNVPKSGEKIVTAIERMANPKTGDSATLRRLFKAMPEKEASSVRATVINRLGRPTSGAAQNADEVGFSFDTFLTNYNNMSARAKATLFPKETRSALNKLATVSQGVKNAGGAMNTSNTAGALVSQGAISGALWWIADPLTAIGAGLGQYAIGRLLASPKFGRILASAPKRRTPQAVRTVSARMGALAKAEPALAREIGLYQKALAANDNVGVSAAASEGPEDE